MELCDKNCNDCPIVNHTNSRMASKILNDLYNKFGREVLVTVNENCCNLTVCPDCGVDDFSHRSSGCEIINP